MITPFGFIFWVTRYNHCDAEPTVTLPIVASASWLICSRAGGLWRVAAQWMGLEPVTCLIHARCP